MDRCETCKFAKSVALSRLLECSRIIDAEQEEEDMTLVSGPRGFETSDLTFYVSPQFGCVLYED